MSAILYHVPLTWIRTQRKLLMPNSVLTSSCVLIFIEQAQYSVLVPSFLQPYTTFTLLYAVCLGKEQGLHILQRKAFSSAYLSLLFHFTLLFTALPSPSSKRLVLCWTSTL